MIRPVSVVSEVSDFLSPLFSLPHVYARAPAGFVIPKEGLSPVDGDSRSLTSLTSPTTAGRQTIAGSSPRRSATERAPDSSGISEQEKRS